MIKFNVGRVVAVHFGWLKNFRIPMMRKCGPRLFGRMVQWACLACDMDQLVRKWTRQGALSAARKRTLRIVL